MPTVRLNFSKNDRIIEFYAVHDLNYSLGISLVPSILNSSASHFPQTPPPFCEWLYSDMLHTIDR
ncbi:hypothetical protein T03_11458 [Trichinella britovi]|uniref:Uncharacterized protein n=1 Tax=Trichinella britovi TaxID=45882 RepID=A0A0V1C5E7_TRIBR|nr:hypothetical protein T03_11458 [Trichinella britovi]